MAVSLFPPSVLFVASTPAAYAVPSGPIETHGSDARLYGLPVNGSRIAFGAHALNGSVVSPQVAPPSELKPATRPCAPPFDQRSCCQTPTTFAWLVPTAAASPAPCGSTWAFV